jgi:hypothetical protein
LTAHTGTTRGGNFWPVGPPRETLPNVLRHARFALLVALPACTAVRPLPPTTPQIPLAAWESPMPGTEAGATPNGRHPPAPALAKTVTGASSAPPPAERAGIAPPPTSAQSSIPGGATCLTELRDKSIPFRTHAPVLGVATPVVLAGPLRGVRFYAADKRPFLADCRLLLALDEVAPDLARLGVTDVRFSGAYVYKLTHPGRMSMHAYGLAVDLHAFRIGGTTLEVKTAFARARGTACNGTSPALNLVACRIRAHGVFKEQLGPDDNAAHFDHFHVALKPLPGEVPEDLPLPAAPDRPKRRARH